MPSEPVVILKADAADALALREAHSDITAGYHMNKVRARRTSTPMRSIAIQVAHE